MNQETILKAAFWVFPLLFAAGAFHATVTGSGADVAEVQQNLSEHRALAAHPVTESRMDTIVTEQRMLREEVAEQAESISAICQATGAQCQ